MQENNSGCFSLNTVYLAVADHCEFITLVTGKRPSLLIAGNNNKVYDKKLQHYAECYTVVNLKPK